MAEIMNKRIKVVFVIVTRIMPKMREARAPERPVERLLEAMILW
jgi:hypothetical protein